MCVVILVPIQSVSSIVSVHSYLGYLDSEIAVDIIFIIDIYIIIIILMKNSIKFIVV